MRQRYNKAGKALFFVVISGSLTGCLMDYGTEVSTTTGAGPGAGNNPPTITGNPLPAVSVGQNYTFTPNASDPDGDTLTFSIQNQPMWASFDPATGTISGVATLGTEGTYANIQISVSDGTSTTTMRTFSIDVTLADLGSTTLSWTPQLENTDGSPLMDLAAYKLYYGTAMGTYPNEILIDNPGITTYVVENLVPNTYYFVATSINELGVESDFSNVATKIVN